MPCLSSFCCGYSLKSGGSFIGYVSAFVCVLLFILCVIVLWCIKLRIDDAGIDGRGFNIFNRFSSFIRARASDNEIEETLQDLKSEKKILAKFTKITSHLVFSIFFLLYLLFLLFGVLCSSLLITGSRLVSHLMRIAIKVTYLLLLLNFQRKPGYLLWWIIYQVFFLIVSAGIVAIFVSIRDERFGLISYFKNYFFKILVTTFIVINLTYVSMLIYFWISVLSLLRVLKREKSRRMKNSSTAFFVESSSGNLAAASNEGTSRSILKVEKPQVISCNTK